MGSRRRKLTDDDVSYFTGVVERDIKAATEAIAGAETPESAQEAMNALEELMPRRARLRVLAGSGAAAKGRSAGRKPTARRAGRKGAPAAPPPASDEGPAAPPPPPEKPQPLVNVSDDADDQWTDEQRTWHLRIESAIRSGKLAAGRVSSAISEITEGKFSNWAELRQGNASVAELQAVHRVLVSYANAARDER